MKLVYLTVIGSWQLFVWWSLSVGLIGTGTGVLIQKQAQDRALVQVTGERDAAQIEVEAVRVEMEALKLDLFECQRQVTLNDEELKNARDEVEKAKTEYAEAVRNGDVDDARALCVRLRALGFECK